MTRRGLPYVVLGAAGLALALLLMPDPFWATVVFAVAAVLLVIAIRVST